MKKTRSSYRYDPATERITILPRPGLLRRFEPQIGRIRAIDEIQEKLAIATELFECHGDDGKAGTYKAIIAVVDHFTSLGFPHAVLLPIANVAATIVDADNGIDSNLFRPDKKPTGRPKKQVHAQAFEGILAAITELCVRHFKAEGVTAFLKPASSLAAKIVNESPLSKIVTPTNMRELRERVSGEPIGSIARDTYESQISGEGAQLHPRQCAEMLASHDWVVAQ